MYNSLIFDTTLEIASENVLNNDRRLYDELMQVVECYIYANELVIGWLYGKDIIVNDFKITKDSYNIEVYSSHAVFHARKLGELASKYFKYISVQTVIPNEKFRVFINGRSMISVMVLPYIKNVKIMNLIKKVLVKGLFNSEINILCIDPISILTNVYHKLYRPNDLKISDIYNIEQKLQKYIQLPDMTKFIKMYEYPDQVVKFTNELINNVECILLYQHMNFRQIIAVNFETIKDQISIQAEKHGISITSSFNNPFIVFDNQLRFYTIYVIYKDIRYPILNIFNSTSYEVIPSINIDGRLFGSIYVILRFLLINLWTLRLLKKLGYIGNKQVHLFRCKILQAYIQLRDLKDESCDIIYKGTYVDEAVCQKRMICNAYEKSDTFYKPYFPTS